MLKTKSTYLAILFAFTLSACNGESDSPTDPIKDPEVPVIPSDPNHAPTITMTPELYDMKGDSVSTLSIETSDDDDDELTLVVSSSNPEVLTVEESNNIVSLTSNSVLTDTDVVVTATVSDGTESVSTTSVVTVTYVDPNTPNTAPEITISPETMSIYESTSSVTIIKSLSVEYSDVDGDSLTVAVSSSNPEALTVSESGGVISITSLSVTEDTDVTVTATVTDGQESSSATSVITILNIDKTSPNTAQVVSITPLTYEMDEGTNGTLSFEASDGDGDVLVLDVSSSNENILTVSESDGVISITSLSVTENTDVTVTVSAYDGRETVSATSLVTVLFLDPIDPEDPPVVIPPEDNDPLLPVDSDSNIVNVGSSLPFGLPSNPLNPSNPIVNKAIIETTVTGTGVHLNYTDNTNGVMLYSKYKLEEGQTSLDQYTSLDYLTGEYDIYNINENLTNDYFTTAVYEVKSSLRNSILPYFPLYSSMNNYKYNLHGGSNIVNCMAAIEYDDHINSGGSLMVLTSDDVLAITAAQLLKTVPTKISPEVINTVLRAATLNNETRKNDIVDDAVFKHKLYDNHFIDAESNARLEDICKGRSEEYNIEMNSLVAISNAKIKMLEVEISKESRTTKAYQNRILLTGFNLEDSSKNKITSDIIENVLIKHMILNKVFNWNGDGYSFLSKHSFMNGTFTGLYEGIAIHYAKQNFSERGAVSQCNPANLSSDCSYPQVYGDYGLMVSYILSADNTLDQLNKATKLIDFIKSLETYNATGCDVEWSEVNNDQVLMSDTCIEKAFDASGFTKIDGSALTWNDLSTNWSTIKNNYIENPLYVSGNSAREILTFN